MGRSQLKALDSRLTVLIAHLLKWQVQVHQSGGSWRGTIVEQRRAIFVLLNRQPSLKQYLPNAVDRVYDRARRIAERDTGLPRERLPAVCPLSLAQILDPGYFPQASPPGTKR